MPEYDVSGYSIRVILNQEMYQDASPKTPMDVEGTVLMVLTHTDLGTTMAQQGKFVELLCCPDYEEECDAFIRWDNDQKEWFTGGWFLFREGKIARCKTIWEQGLKPNIDNTPYHELKPCTTPYKPPSIPFWELAAETKPVEHNTNAYYTDIELVPEDDRWHVVMHQGELVQVKKAPGGRTTVQPFTDNIYEHIEPKTIEVHTIGEPYPQTVEYTTGSITSCRTSSKSSSSYSIPKEYHLAFDDSSE